MLKHFTWQQFLVAALVLSCIWYLVVGLIYRKQIGDHLSGKRKGGDVPEPLGHAWDEDYGEFPEAEEDDERELLGKARLPEGMSTLGMNQFGFAPIVQDEEERETQQGLVPDVIEELKSIFHILEKEQGTKEDFLSLFGLVKAKYPAIRGTANQQALNDYIRDNVLFPVSDAELDNLWN